MADLISQKLQKILASHGLGSRRTMETWIKQGRVLINGALALLGQRVTEDAVITIDGKQLSLSTGKNASAMLMYHKPRGEICTRHDPQHRTTVFDALPQPPSGRWIVIGRLDINTSGLLLFTNNGEWANQLMHPRFHVEREYLVRVYGKMNTEMLTRLTKGVRLADGSAKFDKLTALKGEGCNHWFKVTISSGRNRIVRRLWESQGLKVNRLERVRFGDLSLPETLKLGEFKEISMSIINKLKKLVKVDL